MLNSSKIHIPKTKLRITEIFYSLQGESIFMGLPAVFIRLTGCPLRCTYCDTTYAFTGGNIASVEEILEQVKDYSTPYITVTGGEPLAQKDCFILLRALCDAGYIVSLETSGALDLQNVDSRVVKIMDIKTPSSQEHQRNLWSNLNYLQSSDHIKFIIGHREDFDWAKAKISELKLSSKCQIWFSPSFGHLDAGTLADWILIDRLNVRLQIQLHKILWGDIAGR